MGGGLETLLDTRFAGFLDALRNQRRGVNLLQSYVGLIWTARKATVAPSVRSHAERSRDVGH